MGLYPNNNKQKPLGPSPAMRSMTRQPSYGPRVMPNGAPPVPPAQPQAQPAYPDPDAQPRAQPAPDYNAKALRTLADQYAPRFPGAGAAPAARAQPQYAAPQPASKPGSGSGGGQSPKVPPGGYGAAMPGPSQPVAPQGQYDEQAALAAAAQASAPQSDAPWTSAADAGYVGYDLNGGYYGPDGTYYPPGYSDGATEAPVEAAPVNPEDEDAMMEAFVRGYGPEGLPQPSDYNARPTGGVTFDDGSRGTYLVTDGVPASETASEEGSLVAEGGGNETGDFYGDMPGIDMSVLQGQEEAMLAAAAQEQRKLSQMAAGRGFGASGVTSQGLADIYTGTAAAINQMYTDAELAKEDTITQRGMALLNNDFQKLSLAQQADQFAKTFGLDEKKLDAALKDQDEADAWTALMNMMAATGTKKINPQFLGKVVEALQAGHSPSDVVEGIQIHGPDGDWFGDDTPTGKPAEPGTPEAAAEEAYPDPPEGAGYTEAEWAGMTEEERAAAWKAAEDASAFSQDHGWG